MKSRERLLFIISGVFVLLAVLVTFAIIHTDRIFPQVAAALKTNSWVMQHFGSPVKAVHKSSGPCKIVLQPNGYGQGFYTCDVECQKTNGTIRAYWHYSPKDGVDIYMVGVTNIDWEHPSSRL